MKLLSFALLLMASMAFVLAGCSDNLAPVVEPSDNAVSTAASPIALAKGSAVHSVTGSANAYNVLDPVSGWILPGPKQKGGFYTINTINAFDYGNGVYSGRFVNQFQGKLPEEQVYGFTGKAEAKVIYLAVEGKKALVVAEITKWIAPPGLPDTPWWMAIVFIDNGEGGSAGSPDETGALWATQSAAERDMWLGWGPQEYLDWTWSFIAPYGPTFRVDNGNIQVR